MTVNEYVVLFVAIVYFLGGYVLGRFHHRPTRWITSVDPDPIRTGDAEGLAEVIPLRPARRDKVPPRRETLAALACVADNSRTTYRGLGRRSTPH
jgi:hypothetical protein